MYLGAAKRVRGAGGQIRRVVLRVDGCRGRALACQVISGTPCGTRHLGLLSLLPLILTAATASFCTRSAPGNR